MVVAHVLTSLHVGGGERLTLDLATGQAAAGHRILVVSLEQPADGPLGAAFAAAGFGRRTVDQAAGVRPDVDPAPGAAVSARTGSRSRTSTTACR